MRRPLLLFLYVQILIILILYYLNPFGLGSLLDRSSFLLPKAGSVATAQGTVLRVQIKETYCSLTVDTGSENLLVRLKGQFQDTDKERALYDLCGRQIQIQGEVSIPKGRTNPGCFDYRLYLKGQGVYTIMDVSIYRLKAGAVKRPISHLTALLKSGFYEKAQNLMDKEDFSILAGLLFGDKSYMDDDLYEQFQQNGIAHVLAVSGLHVGLLYSIILKLFGGKQNALTSIATVLILYCYVAISGFSVSVIRAAVMICLSILAFHLRRRYDLVCAASFTAILFLLFNPYQLFDSGFQLSFVAAYSLGTALPWANNKILKLANAKKLDATYDILTAIAPGFCAYIGMMPLIAYHFLNFSLVSLFINSLAIALAALILPAGLILFFVSIIPLSFLSSIFALPCTILTRTLSLLCDIGDKLKLSFSVTAPPFGLLIIYYIFFFYFFSETRVMLNRRHKQPALFVSCFVLIFLCIIMPYSFGITDSVLPWKYNTAYVTFVDVGQGDCCHINLEGYNILIDGGGNYYKNVGKETLKPYLLKNGVSKIDLAIVTHTDMDHSKGIEELNECFKIEKIMYGGDSNEDCLVLSMDIEGLRFLFMADADSKREAALLLENPSLSADIIKLGHHGSATSSSQSFIDTVNPGFAVISCGLNNSYGHPAPRVIELLDDFGIIYGRTDEDGAISYVKSTENLAIFQNAAKDKTWLIPKEK